MMHSDDFPLMPEVEVDLRKGSMSFGREIPGCSPVLVAFGLAPFKNEKKSAEAGYDVYDDIEHVKIVVPGDRQSLYLQPATEVYRQRFPKAHAAFKARDQGGKDSGYPIENWAPMTRGTAMTMKAAHIHTVEALATVDDSMIDRLCQGARGLRDKARIWLKDAADGAATMRVAGEKEALERQLAAMRAQMAAMSNALPPEVRAKLTASAQADVAKLADTTADVGADVAAAARRPRIKQGATA